MYLQPELQDFAIVAVPYKYQYLKHSFASIIFSLRAFLLSVIINFNELKTRSHSVDITEIVSISKAILTKDGQTASCTNHHLIILKLELLGRSEAVK